MSKEERENWDERFRTGDHADAEPDPLLGQIEEYADLFPPERRAGPKALDVACGAGRNAVWLAERGWVVTACDISLEGLRRTQEQARQRGVRVNLFCQDLETISLPANRFDLIVCFFYLQRELFPILKTALRPQGLIVYKTYTLDQQRFAGRPRHEAHLLRHQELLEAFGDFRILFYQEIVKDRGVAQLLAQKTR
ncbi:MAG: class I SAM-dependent methyltransferase [Acidobacteria bacterium]|nr:class I SAM-dependent methyltransferase [Acidobacteriota bacterium]